MIGNASRPPWFTEEHRLYQEATRAFFATELAPHLERFRAQGVVDRELWRAAGQAGLLGATIPEEHGGAGAPLSFDAVALYEQTRTGDMSWGFAIQSIVTHYILAYGTEAQRGRWLPRLATGELVAALAMTEPGTGSDVQSIRTTARPEADAYVVNGSKTFITNGQLANLICVAAKTDPDAPGSRGISLVMVETDEASGFQRGRNHPKMGLKGADT